MPQPSHAALPTKGDALAYVRASSQYEAETQPGTYGAQHVIDHDTKSLWCEGAGGRGEGQSLTFVFKAPQVVDRVVITGAAVGAHVDSVRLSDGVSSVRLVVGGQAVDQVLHTPLRGTQYTLTLETVGGVQGDALAGDVACLAEVELYHGQQNLAAGHDRGSYDAFRSRLVGQWQAAPLGAPESFIVLASDGTWTWVHTPLGGGVSKHLAGTWKVEGNHLLMRRGTTGRFADMGVQAHRVAVDQDDVGAPAADYDVISLTDALCPELASEYNNAHF